MQSSRSQSSLCNCRSHARGLPAFPAVAAVAGLQQPKAQRCPSTRLRSIWDDSLTLSDLREKLDAAVAAEDYAEAARIRDSLQ
jgi:protein-arginine kinase activator protein McsA